MNITRIALTFAAAGMLVWAWQPLAPGQGAGGQDRITVRAGRFVNARTGAAFTPFGVNYCVVGDFKNGKRGHATFSPSHYDREFVSGMMRNLENWGCNTVRVFHAYVAAEDGIVKSRDATELSPEYVANFLDFLEQARTHGIRAIVSFDVWGTGCPWLRDHKLPVDSDSRFPLDQWNERYKRNNFQLCRTAARERANTILEFIRAIRKHDPALAPTILAWELENELNLRDDYPPFDGSVQKTTFKGRTFDLRDDADRQAYLDAVFVNWCDYIRSAIRHEDPDVLVSASVFTFAAVGLERPAAFTGVMRRDHRMPARPLALLDSGIDFVDIHSYVWRDRDGKRDEFWYLRRNMESVEMEALRAKAAKLGKPILIGETGVHNYYTNRPGLSIPDRVKLGADYLDNHVRALRDTYRVAGVLFWTYGTRALPRHKLYYDLNRQPYVRRQFLDAWQGTSRATKEKTPVSPASPVRIEDNKFVLTATGAPYVPRGFNYVRLDLEGKGGHATFSPFVYDRKRVTAAFRHMADNGFNVVRVFINGLRGRRGCMFASREAAEPDARYLDNLAEFLLLAKQHGLLVVPCFVFFPEAGPYREGLGARVDNIGRVNNHYLNAAFINAKKRYLRDVICELRKRDPATLSAVFCWDLMNEVCFALGAPPFSLSEGRVSPANGITYDLARDKERLADDMAVYWVDQMASAIREEIPDALINANVFTYHAVGRKGPGDFHREKAAWKNRYPFRPTALLRSTADVIDIHFYARSTADLSNDLKSIEHDPLIAGLAKASDKALIVGEFGVFKKAFPELRASAEWVGTMADRFPAAGFAGWIYWTYDTDEQKQLWNAMSDGGVAFNALISHKGDRR